MTTGWLWKALQATMCVLALTLGPPARAMQEPIEVVVTTTMLADAVREVGGARVKVTALMGPGVDPHTWRQTHADIVRLARADIVLWHGLHLEAQLEPMLVRLARRKPVVALAERVPRELLLRDEDHPARFDPHVWMDPRLWQHVVLAARDVLTRGDPAGRATYARNAERYRGELAALAQRLDGMYRGVPPARRVLVTAHDAFHYFGRAHGYEVMGVQGISTDSEAGLNRIEELVGVIVRRRIAAVFAETSAPDQNVRALVEGAARRGVTVSLGGELYADAMGPPGSPAGTYAGMLEHNARTITRALGARADGHAWGNTR